MKPLVTAFLVGVVLFRCQAAYVGIHAAAAEGNLEKLKEYLAEDPRSISSRNGAGRTPLCVAAMCGHTKAVEFLLAQHAEVNDRGFQEMTPLGDLAAYSTSNDQQCAEVAAILLAHGAQVDASDAYKDTPLLHAVESKKCRLTRVLLEHGASLSSTYSGANSGMTPLHMAIMDSDKEMVKALLEFNAPLDLTNRDGATPLLLAEQRDNTEIAALLRQAAPTSTQSAKATAAVPPTREEMRAIARRIASGEAPGCDQLVSVAETLYREVNYQKGGARLRLNLDRMRAAFNVLGNEAGQGNERAFQALKKSLRMHYLSSFAPEGLGIAAAGGNQAALAMLLKYEQWDIPQITANYALCLPAQTNVEAAVDYFVTWLKGDQPFKTGVGEVMNVTNAMAGAATLGNLKAKDALERFAIAHPSEKQPSR